MKLVEITYDIYFTHYFIYCLRYGQKLVLLFSLKFHLPLKHVILTIILSHIDFLSFLVFCFCNFDQAVYIASLQLKENAD